MRKTMLSLATAALVVGIMGSTAGGAEAGPRHHHWHHGHHWNHHMRLHGGRNSWRRDHFHPQVCGWRVDYRHHHGKVWRCWPALMTR